MADSPMSTAGGADDHGSRILISTWVLLGLSSAFLVARLYCKWRAHRGLWWDDNILILSWVALLGTVATTTWSVPHGLGRHIYAVPPANLAMLGIVGNVTGSLSILAAVWSKTSFALTLLRVMRGDGRAGSRALLWFLIVTTNIAMGLNALFVWVRCSPVAKTWNYQLEGSCWAPNVYPTFGMFAAGYSAAADFVLALFPWTIIWNLQMKGKEKFGVAVAMSMGIFAGGTSIVKTLEIPALATGDFTYSLTGLVIWGTAESAVTIMAASIPVLRTLFHDIRLSTKRSYVSGAIADDRTSASSSGAPDIERRPSCRSDEGIILSEADRGQITRSVCVEIRYHAKGGSGDGEKDDDAHLDGTDLEKGADG